MGRLGAVLEPPWGIWGRLVAVLARLRAALEAYLARFGSLLARPWDVLGRLGASSGRFGSDTKKN